MLNANAGQGGAGAARIFAALGDGTRLALFNRLSDGSLRSIATLSSDTKLTRQAVTKHLRMLEKAGLVKSVRRGRESRFSFRVEPVAEMQAYLEQVSRRWDEALLRLKAFVEE